jgi:hypothetical protein
MKELSIFVDESGTFGPYEYHSQFYLVTLVFHDQSLDITENIKHLNSNIFDSGIPNHTIHAGPLIRREYEYDRYSLLERKRIFNFLYNFVRTIDIKYHTIVVAKKHLAEDIDLVISISRKLSSFLHSHMEMLIKYDRIVVYYDYGQRELTHILAQVLSRGAMRYSLHHPKDIILFLSCVIDHTNYTIKVINGVSLYVSLLI